MSDGAAVVVGGGPGGPSTDAALARAVAGLRDFAARPGYAFSDAELLANLRGVHAFLATADAAYLGLVAELDSRAGALPGVPAGRTAATFLREALRVAGPRAGRDVRAARAIASACPELPVMGAALADGTVWRDHLAVAVSTLARIPKALRTATVEQVDPATGEATGVCVTGARAIDELLTARSQDLPPSTVEVLGRQIVARLDPDRAERFDADAYRRRSYTWSRDFAGMGVYKFVVDPATDALLQAAIDAWSAPRPTGTALDEHGRTVPVPDGRTPTQRKADAVADLIQAGATTRPHPHSDTDQPADQPDADQPDQSGEPGDQPVDDRSGDEVSDDPGDGPVDDGPARRPCTRPARPFPGVQVTVVATLDQLAAEFGAGDPAARTAGLARISLAGPIGNYSGATLTPETLARLACDTPIRRILTDDASTVLDHGCQRRLKSDPQTSSES